MSSSNSATAATTAASASIVSASSGSAGANTIASSIASSSASSLSATSSLASASLTSTSLASSSQSLTLTSTSASSASSTSSAASSAHSSSSNTGVIVGAVLGSLVGLAILGAALVVLGRMRRQKRRRMDEEAEAASLLAFLGREDDFSDLKRQSMATGVPLREALLSHDFGRLSRADLQPSEARDYAPAAGGDPPRTRGPGLGLATTAAPQPASAAGSSPAPLEMRPVTLYDPPLSAKTEDSNHALAPYNAVPSATLSPSADGPAAAAVDGSSPHDQSTRTAAIPPPHAGSTFEQDYAAALAGATASLELSPTPTLAPKHQGNEPHPGKAP